MKKNLMKRKMILLTMLLLLGYGYSNAQYGPVVSFTYDDGYPSWWDLGFPIYQEYGFPAVAYINATNWWVSGVGYGAIDKLRQMQSVGWEVSNHAYNHISNYTETDVSEMKEWLDSLGFPNSGFAAPYNVWDHNRVNIIKKYHPYFSGMDTQDGGLTQPIDLYFLRRYSLTNDVNPDSILSRLADAVANNKWIIFYGHEIGNGGGFFQSVQLLRMALDEVVARKIPVRTVREVINDLFPPGCVIECSRDTMQYPVLPYFEEGGPGAFNSSVWNEYWHITNWWGPQYSGSPAVYCHTSNDSLPIMKFYRNVPNGEYEVKATILEYNQGRTYRLYYSFDENNPSQYSVDVTKNSEVSLGTITVTNGQFALYTQKADAISGEDGYVGWAFIKLFTQINSNLKVNLEGCYSNGSMTTLLNSTGMLPMSQPYKVAPWNYTGSERVYDMPADIVDWVLVELRTDTAANTTVGRRAALLKSDGSIVDLDGASQVLFRRITPGNYYIVIRHRNHLSIMSASPISLNFTNSTVYDFRSAQTQAFGTNAMQDLGGGVFGMIAADANSDGTINATDLNAFWIPQNGTPYNYQTKTSDFNLDATINATDLNLFWIPENGKATQVP